MKHPSSHPALTRAIAAALPAVPTLPIIAAQPGATPRNTAQQIRPPAQNEARSPAANKPLKPIQRTAARLLLLGHPTSVVAHSLRIHPYTLSRWKRDPRFHRELDRQLAAHLAFDHDDQPQPAQPGATSRNTAQQNRPPAQNEPTAHHPVYGQ